MADRRIGKRHMNKCPQKKVKIDAKTYELIPIDRHFNNGWHYGEINYADQEILYSIHQARQQLEDTICHECIHGMSLERQIGLNEDQTSALGSSIHAWIIQNEALILWMLGRNKDGTRSDK